MAGLQHVGAGRMVAAAMIILLAIVTYVHFRSRGTRALAQRTQGLGREAMQEEERELYTLRLEGQQQQKEKAAAHVKSKAASVQKAHPEDRIRWRNLGAEPESNVFQARKEGDSVELKLATKRSLRYVKAK